jgi:hypothetical protein
LIHYSRVAYCFNLGFIFLNSDIFFSLRPGPGCVGFGFLRHHGFATRGCVAVTAAPAPAAAATVAAAPAATALAAVPAATAATAALGTGTATAASPTLS